MSLELVLSVYATLIATSVLFWNIYTYLNDRKARLEVNQQKIYQYAVNGQGGISQSHIEVLKVSITNKGKSERYIEKPLFEINGQNTQYNRFTTLTKVDINTTYPMTIKPGERKEYNVALESIKDEMIKAKGATKVKAIIKDTHGKQFASKWLKIA